MDQSRTFLRNVTSLTTANVLTLIVQGVVSMFILNHLGPERYGSFRTALAFATVFLIFAETGVGARLLFDRSSDKSAIDEHFGAALVLQMGPYLIVLGLTMAAAALFHYPGEVVTMIAILSAAAVLRTFGEVCDKVITVYQQIHLNAIMRSARFMSVALGGIVVIVFDLGPVAWALVWLAASAVYAAGTLAMSLAFARPRFVLSSLWPTLSASYIFGLGAIFYAIYESVDQVMLSKMMPEDSWRATVGIYGAAYTLMMFTYSIPASFTASIEPIVFGARGNSPRLARLANLSSLSLGVVALPLTAGTILLAQEVRGLVLPNYGAAAAGALSVLALFGLFRFLNFPGGILMAAAGMQNRRVAIQGAAVILNVSLNFAFIPRYGLFGAAWATVATEVLIFGLYQASLVRALPGFGDFGRFVKPVIATGLMSIFTCASLLSLIRTVGENRFLWLAIVPVAVAVYFGTLWLLRFFTPDESEFLGRILARFLFWRKAQ